MTPKLVLRFLGVGMACAAFSTLTTQSALAASSSASSYAEAASSQSAFTASSSAEAPAAGALTASSSAEAAGCDQSLSQPFLSYGQSGWYWLAAGQSPGAFLGNGWTLSGGAKVVSTPIANGETSTVLDLPSGSRATSPAMCIQSGDALARVIARTTVGQFSLNTSFQAWNASTQTPIGGAMPLFAMSNWTLSPPLVVVPGLLPGSSEVYFTFTAQARSGAQLYDFYIDPFMRD